MKKLIIILFMFSFALNAQKNWEFKPNKAKHLIVGAVLPIPSYYLMYNYTQDHEVSRNSAWMFPVFIAMGKEFLDAGKLITTGQGVGFSFADFGYTVGGAIITTIVITRIQKRRQKKWRKKFEIEF